MAPLNGPTQATVSETGSDEESEKGFSSRPGSHAITNWPGWASRLRSSSKVRVR